MLQDFKCIYRSTDSELKCWQTVSGACLRTYRGHSNDKNFVGLTVTPDFIACGKTLHLVVATLSTLPYIGSENNAVYVYAKQVSSPMLIYQYNTARGLLVREYSIGVRGMTWLSLL